VLRYPPLHPSQEGNYKKAPAKERNYKKAPAKERNYKKVPSLEGIKGWVVFLFPSSPPILGGD